MLSKRAWSKSQCIITAIESHPFLVELGNGTLNASIFQRYLQQDHLYLESCLKVFALIMAKIDKQHRSYFINNMDGMITLEQTTIHQHYGIRLSNLKAIKPTQATIAYTSFVLSHAAVDPVYIAVASVLPCSWIYQHIATLLKKKYVKNNPYQRWIDFYASDCFLAATRTMQSIFNQVAHTLHVSEQEKMIVAFYQATCFEWHFWNDAYYHRLFDDLGC